MSRLDDDLYALSCSDEPRGMLRETLVASYFDDDAQRRIREQAKVNADAYKYTELLLTESQIDRVREASDTLSDVARDQGFRRAVVGAYNQGCGMCGVRVVTPDGHTAVDASHIVPWSESRDDRPANGIALCRLCHWVFDEGLSSVSEHYVVIVSRQLFSDGNLPGHLSTVSGREILRPADLSLWPDLRCLAWHRRHTFRRL